MLAKAYNAGVAAGLEGRSTITANKGRNNKRKPTRKNTRYDNKKYKAYYGKSYYGKRKRKSSSYRFTLKSLRQAPQNTHFN